MVDNCISNIFGPGNPGNGTATGSVSTPHYSGFLLTEEMTEGDDLDHLNDVTPSIFVPGGSTWHVTITGTWSGAIAIDTGYSAEDIPMNGDATIVANGVYSEGPVAFSFYQRFRMASYSSGVAVLDIHILRNQYILIEEAGVTVTADGAMATSAIGRLKLE